MSSFTAYYPTATKIAHNLLHNPELGFKEFTTKQIIVQAIHDIDPNIKIQEFLDTGLKVDFNHGKKRTVGVIAEIDALYQPKHFLANPKTGAAHACGHYTQVVIALAMINELVNNDRLKDFKSNLSFIFTPAEEFVDLAWRKQQKEAGKISFFGGKQEAIKRGVFDDIDCFVSVHAIGEVFHQTTAEIGCDLAGFNFKYFDFYGKASHAAFAPDAGVNAHSIATLFTTALALQRQQVKNPNQIRFNPVMIGQNTESINVIPNHVQMGTDLRYFDLAEAKKLMARFEAAAHGCAHALGGQAKTTTQVGYLPLISNKDMNKLVKQVFQKDDAVQHLIEHRGYTMAGGDVGDVSYIMPTIQIGYGGWTGRIHGTDFKLTDPQYVLSTFPEFVFASTLNIANHLDQVQLYGRSKQDYLDKLASMEAKE